MNGNSRTLLRAGTAALWGAVLVAAFATTLPRPWLLTIAGVCCGCVSGHLRSRATATGASIKAANALGWLCGAGLLLLAMAFAKNMFVGAWVASVSGYLLADKLYSLAASHRRGRALFGAAADGIE